MVTCKILTCSLVSSPPLLFPLFLQAYLLLESVHTHAGAKIKDLKQSSKSQQRLRALLEEAHGYQVEGWRLFELDLGLEEASPPL